MKHVSKSITTTPRWARTLVLLGVVGLMPVGLAQAGELTGKQGDRAEHHEKEIDGPAVMAQIRAAVERGDITPEEGRRKAQEVRAWLAQQDAPGPRRDRAGRDRADADQDQDRDRAERDREGSRAAEGIEGRLRELGIDEQGYSEIVAYLAKGGVGRIQMEATLGATLRLMHVMKEQGGDFALGDDMAGYLHREIGLDRDQIGMVVELAQKLAEGRGEREGDAEPGEKDKPDIRGYFLRLGLDEDGLDAVVGVLQDNGVGRVQIDPTLGGLFHTVLGIHEHGLEATVGDEKFHDYFTLQVGLDEEQIELVTRLAQRIARATGPDEREGDRGEAGDDRRERETDRAPRRERREREAEREERRERGEAGEHGEDKPDFAATARRVRRAHEAGELSREEAGRAMRGLREQMVHQVELALEADKITREEARAKIAAIREMTQLPERQRERDNDSDRPER